MSESILQVRNLRKSFRSRLTLKKSEVLKGISFELKKGVVTGFLGSNGAGKTTTIKCLLGLIYPDQGEVRFFGEDLNSEAVRSRIGFLPERPYFYEYLSAEEYLRFAGRLCGMPADSNLSRRIEELLELVELTHAKSRPLREYSKGMLQRTGIAQALIHRPEFVILDEPQSGLDPDGRYKVSQILQAIADQGTTVFFSSHLLNDAEALCENLVILSRGEVVYTGEMESLLSRLQVGHIIRYRTDQKTIEEKVGSESELQKTIDRIRREGSVILEVANDRPSLERAFVEISSGRL